MQRWLAPSIRDGEVMDGVADDLVGDSLSLAGDGVFVDRPGCRVHVAHPDGEVMDGAAGIDGMAAVCGSIRCAGGEEAVRACGPTEGVGDLGMFIVTLKAVAYVGQVVL